LIQPKFRICISTHFDNLKGSVVSLCEFPFRLVREATPCYIWDIKSCFSFTGCRVFPDYQKQELGIRNISMLTFNLVDTSFPHSNSSVGSRKPTSVSWNRGEAINGVPTFVTDRSIEFHTGSIDHENLAYAWTIESSSIQPAVIRKLISSSGRFETVFTHNSKLLNSLPNAKFSPGGGVWIGDSRVGGTLGIHRKTNLVSMLTSGKIQTKLHRFRLGLAWEFKHFHPGLVDVWLNPPAISSWEVLESYAFNVAIENFRDETYFTEKLLNCFATGTVPIYHGATGISEFFDPRGILQFETKSELRDTLETLDFSDYEKMLPYIKENYERVQEYILIEDYISGKYFDKA